ncbi:hypothetical protein, partial [Mesorhizobium sp. f-mel]
GMSPGCPMTGRQTAGSMQDGLREVATLPEITATNEGSARSIRGTFRARRGPSSSPHFMQLYIDHRTDSGAACNFSPNGVTR